MNRRRLLATVGSIAGATSLAGCSGEVDGDKKSTDVEYPPPSVADGLWKQSADSVITFDQTGVSGEGAVRTYENSTSRSTIERRFAGQFSQSLTVGYAAHLEYGGVSTTLVTGNRLLNEVKPLFRDRISKIGLTNIEELSEDEWDSDSQPDPTLETGRAYTEYRATYPVPEQSASFEIAEYGSQDLSYSEQSIEMRVLLLVTDLTTIGGDGEAYVLGGAYPTEDYQNSSTTTLAESGDASLELTVSLNTGLSEFESRSAIVDEFIEHLLEVVE